LRFFFYGTLIDADVRRLVLGRLAPDEVEPATLSGWRRVKLAGVTYPGIVPDAKGWVEGVLADWQRRHKRRFIASLARSGNPS
jgi:hypothetical protein